MVEEARSHSSAETPPAAAGAAAAGAMNHRPHFAKDPEEKKQEEDAVVVVVAAEEERRKRRKVERHGGVERDASGGGGGREEVVDGGGGGGGGGDARDDEAHWDAAAAAAAAADTKEEKDRELNGYVDGDDDDDDDDEEQGVRGQTKEGEQGEHVNALSSSGDDEIENDGAEDVFKSPAPVHSPPIKKIRLIPSRRRRERSPTTATDPSSSSSSASARCWQPNRYLEPSKPPPDESIKLQQYQVALKAAEKWNGGVDFAGRPPKLLKPRRTVDYMAEVGRMRILAKTRIGMPLAPTIHPSPSNMSNLLPPAAYPRNPTSSVCDVFVHSSMNKERSTISVAKWAPEGRWCITGNSVGQFTLWNGATFNFESIKQAHDHPIRALSYTHSGSFFISTDQSGALKYYTPQINNLTTIQAHREACRAVSFSPNDDKFATGGDDGVVKVWNFGQGAEEKTLTGHGWDVRCVEWHPSKGLIASGSKDLLVKFWDPRSGKDLSTLHSHRAVVNACAWSPDGNVLASAGGDGLVRLFDIRTFQELEPLKGHQKEVTAIAWHPVHRSLLSTGGMDGQIMHWCLDQAEPSKPVSDVQYAHDQAVWALDYHPLGYVLTSASKDCSTRFWCRARPVGGQETDRWHVGDTQSNLLGTNNPQRVDDDDDQDMPLPGLGGLQQQIQSQQEQSVKQEHTSASPDFALPGLPRRPMASSSNTNDPRARYASFLPPPGAGMPMPMPTLTGGGSLPPPPPPPSMRQAPPPFGAPPPSGYGPPGGYSADPSQSYGRPPPNFGGPPPVPPQQQGGGGGGIRRGGPLPSQMDMLNHNGVSAGRRGGGRR